MMALVWFSLPGQASIFSPREGTKKSWITSLAVTTIRMCVSIGATILLSTSRECSCPSSSRSSGMMYDSSWIVSPLSLMKSEYSYTQYHWYPMALIVIAGSITSSLRYRSTKDGRAIRIRITAGKIVHTTSRVVP